MTEKEIRRVMQLIRDRDDILGMLPVGDLHSGPSGRKVTKVNDYGIAVVPEIGADAEARSIIRDAAYALDEKLQDHVLNKAKKLTAEIREMGVDNDCFARRGLRRD